MDNILLSTVSTESSELTELPQDIIDACREIQDRVWEDTDPTQISNLGILRRNYILNPGSYILDKDSEVQYFISLLTRGILPTCEILKYKGEFHSLAMNHTYIRETISIPEVVADLVLLHILTDAHQLIDRSFYTIGEGKQENFIFSEGSLSIYDLEIEIGNTNIYDIGSIIKIILKHITRIKGWNEESGNFKALVRCKNNQFLFVHRLKEKIKLFLQQYSNHEGKEFFMWILKTSGASDEYQREGISLEDLYTTFIENLKKIETFVDGK